MTHNRLKRKLTIFLLTIMIAIIFMMAGFYIYTLDYYRTSDDVDAIISESQLFIVTKGNLTIVYANSEHKNGEGIIFYPGGKVESNAYLPLLMQLAERGYTSVLVNMPFNLAVFNINAADEAMSSVPEIDQWTLMGHSLGGAMASSYMKDHYESFEALILLGAYPVNDAPICTLAIYGTYDLMLDLEKVAEADRVEEIEGGNHAYFGNYGEQKGDGVALISREKQQAITVDLIDNYIRFDSLKMCDTD